MRLLHYSAEPLGPIRSEPQVALDWKPDGLWVSVEGPMDWPEWCQSENFRLDQFVHTTEIVLALDANILYLTTPDEIRAFGKKYAAPGHGGLYIDWGRVALEYQGIIITPYQWECRHSEMWYYTWDCASGCIWDRAAILTTMPVEQKALADAG